MAQTLGHVTLVVRDYDEAVTFFTCALGFSYQRYCSGPRQALDPRRSTEISGHELASRPSVNTRRGQSYWQPDRRASLSFSAYRRFLAGLR